LKAIKRLCARLLKKPRQTPYDDQTTMDLSGKKVLVTGADGFIGSHLVEHLLEEGCKVKAFVYYNSFNSWGWLDGLPADKLKQLEIFAGDIRDPNGVREAMKGTEVVFHLAALIAIPFSIIHPTHTSTPMLRGH
jgi:nucleoside-diphosphate-sugar epimerase